MKKLATSLKNMRSLNGGELLKFIEEYKERSTLLRPPSLKHNYGTLMRFYNWLDGREYNVINGEKYRDEFVKQNRFSTAWSYTKVLKTFGNWLEEQEYVEKSPMAKLHLPKQTVRDEYVPEYEVALKIIEEGTKPCKADNVKGRASKEESYLCLMFILHSAVRGGGAVKLTAEAEDVDFANGAYKVMLKGGKIVTNPMMDTCAQILKKAVKRRPTGRLWTVNQETLRACVKRGCLKVGVPVCRVHDLRASFATDMAFLDCPGPLVSKMLNHTKPGVTEKYYIKAERRKLKTYLDIHHPSSAKFATVESLKKVLLDSPMTKLLQDSGKFDVVVEEDAVVFRVLAMV